MDYNEVIRLSTSMAFSQVLELLSDNPQTISARTAKAKYKGLLTLWESQGLITGIPTNNGKHLCYNARRLVELYRAYTEGKI